MQPIGGVTEKIEGFFDICKARGLSGDQGVIIPQSNIKHLMLREEVVAACAEGRFRRICRRGCRPGHRIADRRAGWRA
ncbi:MAG: hypothetical protein M5R42_04410 [Rhodocyclaceae bacterium]|nr:hypothetical protein [Rhodocyclaceae bacterium]